MQQQQSGNQPRQGLEGADKGWVWSRTLVQAPTSTIHVPTRVGRVWVLGFEWSTGVIGSGLKDGLDGQLIGA